MKKLMLLLLVALLVASAGMAQTADNKFALGLNATHSEYLGDLGNAL